MPTDLHPTVTPLFAQRTLTVLVLMFLVGTQMPGAWRAGIEGNLHAPFALSSWAHFVLVAVMAWIAVGPLAWSWRRVVLAALALALITEGLQFFASDRHPRLLDVGIDMAGALMGLILGKRMKRE